MKHHQLLSSYPF